MNKKEKLVEKLKIIRNVVSATSIEEKERVLKEEQTKRSEILDEHILKGKTK